jgi:crotonobetainyl-CoA:carnitine CoA-transferase CaiB-like acyl-CoA transferase
VLLALWAREQGGSGQSVAVNMLAANAYANADDMLRYAGKPERPTVGEGLYGLGACYRLYAAASGWVFLAIARDREWKAFAKAAGPHPVFSDASFATADLRREHDDALAAALASLFAERDAQVWQDLLLAQGVGCVRADGSVGGFLLDDPHADAEGLVPEVEHRRFGRTRRWGPLVVCNGGPESLGPGALAGGHTNELLRELGRSPAEIEELRSRRVVASEAV